MRVIWTSVALIIAGIVLQQLPVAAATQPTSGFWFNWELLINSLGRVALVLGAALLGAGVVLLSLKHR
ncbi:MAG: hypothetical protein CSA81_13805 [Acidobacteria bacterium]|nr:MAG: hypothetical protein CSA81_13805 [Acidobacteriota bacterium]